MEAATQNLSTIWVTVPPSVTLTPPSRRNLTAHRPKITGFRPARPPDIAPGADANATGRNDSGFMMLVEDFSDYFYSSLNSTVSENKTLFPSETFEFQNCSVNGSAGNVSECAGSGPELEYNVWALTLLIFPVLTLFGNVLVIMSVVRERALQTVTNYFIVSLAVADLLVAVVVMPFGVYYLVNGVWGLPAFVCDFYIAMDVTCSTSSIFNLVAISVDRYIAVTQPIKYAKHKNNRRVWLTILLVWLVSAAIGLPIVLGLNNTPDRRFDECLFNSRDYVIYSSLSSFYIPCIMMMFLYYNIFKALRNRAKKQRAARKPPVSGEPTATGTTAVVIENVAQTRRLAETALHDDRPTNTASGSNEDDQDEGESFERRSELDADVDDCHVIPNDKSTEFNLATVVEESGHVTTSLTFAPAVDPNGNNDSGYAPSNLEETIREQASPPASPARRDAAPHARRLDDGRSSLKKNGSTRSPRQEKSARTASTIVRCAEELTRLGSAASSASSKKERKASAAATRFTIYKVNKASKKKREKSSAKKERKATKTLAIVLGVFLFCWAPFFSCSVLDAVCGKLGANCSPGVTAFILTTWLGYINSFLNPVIYTIFNPEFRKAFKKIMHCGT